MKPGTDKALFYKRMGLWFSAALERERDTQDQMAEKLKTTQPTVHRILRGGQAFSAYTLSLFCREYLVDPRIMFKRDPTDEDRKPSGE